MKKNIVLVSGGLSSFATFYHVIKKYGKYNTYALFTDVVIEDDDLYRFLLQTIEVSYNKIKINNRLNLPGLEKIEARKNHLKKIRNLYQRFYKNFIWLSKDKTPFNIFEEVKFMGNSRIDPCSKVLKRELAKNYIKSFKPSEIVVYIGFDQDEPNRIEKASKFWEPYKVKFPLAENPLLYSKAMDYLKEKNIEIPKLYKLGFTHNNCGGFCVKAGQKQFKKLEETLPERYNIFSKMENKVYEKIGKYPFIKKTENKEVSYYTMEEFKKVDLNSDEDSSCSCFM